MSDIQGFTKYSNEELSKITIEQLPDVIGAQYNKIIEIDGKIKNAERKTQIAKKMQKNAETAAEKSLDSAKEAGELAEVSYNKNTGIGHKKEAINALQDSQKAMAEAQVDAAKAQTKTADAVKSLSYAQSSQMEAIAATQENQKQMAEATRFLYMLGCSTMAANNTVVNQLEMKLKNAAEEEISEMARAELVNVINQLKSQENIARQQQKIQTTLNSHVEALNKTFEEIHDIDIKVDKNDLRDDTQDARLTAGEKKDAAQDETIAANAAKNEEQDRMLAENLMHDNTQDKRLDAGEAKDIAQDEKIAANAYKNEEHDQLISELIARIEELEKNTTSDVNKKAIAGMIISILAVIITIIQFFF